MRRVLATGRQARDADAPRRCRHVPAGQGRGHARAQDACRMGRDRRLHRRIHQRGARRGRARGRHRHHRAAPPRDGGRRDRPAAPVRRRDRHLHHAGLPLPGDRPAAHQLPPAALDPVHAGLRLRRPRAHEGRLRARQGRALPVLFLRRRLPAASGARRARHRAGPGHERHRVLVHPACDLGHGPARAPCHRPRHGRDPRLHAGRHARHGQGDDARRGARHRRRDDPRQHLPPDAAPGLGGHREARRAAPLHGLARADPHQIPAASR